MASPQKKIPESPITKVTELSHLLEQNDRSDGRKPILSKPDL
jgi:hypothetical protein